ncbi:MAG: FecR family protein [Bacteroides nordii]
MDKNYNTYKADQLLDDDYFLMSEQHPTPETRKFWKAQQKRFPELAHEIELARKVMSAFKKETTEVLSEEDVDILWNRIQKVNRQQDKRKTFSMISRWSVAACFAIVIAGGWLVVKHHTESDKFMSVVAALPKPDKTATDVQLILSEDKEIVIDTKKSHIVYDKDGQIRVETEKSTEVMEDNEDVSYNQLVVPLGKSSSITFTDGTKIWVNAGTRVVYPAAFEQRQREIYVEGEAYLEVAPDETRPFIVKTDGMQVRVLGTKFNVNAYTDDVVKEVALVSGKVEVLTDKKEEVLLKPNQLLSYNNDQIKVKNVDATQYTLWKDGLYQYYHEYLNKVFKSLSRYYGREIICGEGVATLTCSGKLDLKNELSDVLDVLKRAAPIEVYETDEKIYINVKP